jgi:epoxyqueuosine reductase QueG
VSTAADRIMANAQRFRTPSAEAQEPPAKSTATEATRPAVREKDVRRTVDLSPTQHRQLDMWQREAADNLGYARVTGQEVLSALVDLLLDDQEVAARVLRMLPARR